MDKQLSGTFHEKMREAWHTFVSGGEIDEELVRPEIAKSWLRSREYGVDPRADLTVSDGHDISDRLKKSSMLITAAREPVAALAQMVKGTGFRINLTDSEGYFLISEGDEAVLQRTSVLNSHIGVCRNESSAGTCGISLSLIEDKPIQVNSFEHYNKYLHDWTCSSAPIHDQSSNIVGVLNISGHYTLVHRHTLGMVVGLARAIELAITNQNSIRQLNRCGKISNMIIQEAYEGVVIFDGEGKICLSNQRGIDILSSLIGSRYITSIQLLRQHTDIFDFDRGLFEREISIVIEGKRKSFYMTVRTMPETGKRDLYYCIFFKSIEEVHKIAQRVHGQQAFYTFDNIVGAHELIKKAVNEGQLVANERAPILIIGKTGTGKEMFAQAIHNYSLRRNGPFIAINCGAIPAELIESELFGYEAGAFTGARKGGKPGKIGMAHTGTLFLDELDSMPHNMQIKLLRVLQTCVVNRIGSEKSIPVNIRLISASKKDLMEEVEKGIFRDDLFFRVNTITITLPPLSERKRDIKLLCDFFLKRLISCTYKPIRGIAPDVYRIFESYSWPGNVRELEGCIERAFLFENSNYITKNSIPAYINKRVEPCSTDMDVTGRGSLRDHEHILIEKTLKECDRNISKAARRLGIGRDTLYRKIKIHDLSK